MLSVLLLLLICVILLRLSAVQTYLGNIATNQINERYDTNIVVEKVDLSFGSVNLKNIIIKDHHKDSLINVNSLETSVFGYKNILDNKLLLGEVAIEGLVLNMVTYKDEDHPREVAVEDFGC